jgi:outer membrane lipoprotein-sorting protein
MKIVLKLFILSFISIAVYSCSSSEKIAKKDLSFEEIISEAEANYQKINSYTATGILDLNLKNLKMNLGISIQTLKPSKAQIQISGPFGIDVASVYLKEDSIFIYDLINDRLIETNFSSPKLQRFFKKGFSREIVYSLLFAYLNLDAIQADSSIIKTFENKFCISKFYDQGRYDIYYDKSNAFISEITFSPIDSEPELIVQFLEVQKFDSITFPKKLLVDFVKSKEDVTIELKKIQFNSNKTDLDFSLPEDVEVIKW